MAWVVGIGFFLLLLFAFPKQMGILIALCAMVVAVVVLYEQFERADKQRLAARIMTVAMYSEARCSKEYPIVVETTNRSSKTIKKIYFDLQGYRENHSDTVLSSFTTSDRIMKPGESYVSCYKMPYGFNHPSQRWLSWRAKVSRAEPL